MNAAPTISEVPARTVNGGRAEVNVGAETVVFDASRAAEPSGPGPTEPRAAGFPACVPENVEWASPPSPFRYQHAEVAVVARRHDTRPKFVEIIDGLRLVTDKPEHREYGTVYDTLAAAYPVDGRIVVVDPPPSSP